MIVIRSVVLFSDIFHAVGRKKIKILFNGKQKTVSTEERKPDKHHSRNKIGRNGRIPHACSESHNPLRFMHLKNQAFFDSNDFLVLKKCCFVVMMEPINKVPENQFSNPNSCHRG